MYLIWLGLAVLLLIAIGVVAAFNLTATLWASLALSTLGWAGLILGVVAIVLAVIARVKMGYFNTYIIAALLCSIFGVVFSVASIVITAIDPEFFSRLLESINN